MLSCFSSLEACSEYTIISKEKVPQHGPLDLGKSMKSAHVEQFPIHSLLDADSLITVCECISQHGRKIMLKRVGANMQPCLTLFESMKASEQSPLSTQALTPLWHKLTMEMNLSGQPNFAIIFQRPSQLMVSKALVRSPNMVHSSLFCSCIFPGVGMLQGSC